MRHHASRALNMRTLFMVLFLLLLGGCAAPKHSNTLIFGTTTSFALAVSQEPTGSLGITVGYKRNEAVFMPLLANKADDKGGMVPADCTASNTVDCPKFTGVGSAGGPAGTGAVDTYSVLATFSGSGGATNNTTDGVAAKGSIAQYFATGLAARLLAANGGAALVNSNADPAVATKSTSVTSIGAVTEDQVLSVEKLNDAIFADSTTVDQTKSALKALGVADASIPGDLAGNRKMLNTMLKQARHQTTSDKRDSELKKMTDAFKTAGMLS